MNITKFLCKATLLAGCFALSLASCSKDDDNGGSNGNGKGNGKIGGNHEYVDLGLESGTLWATCNIGASKPEEYGDYFSWGMTETQEYYGDEDNPWMWIEPTELQSQGVIDSNYNLTPKYDVATVKWGSDWRMPTSDEMEELRRLEYETTNLNGIKGIKFIGNNGNTLFIPYSGYYHWDELGYVGESFIVWTSHRSAYSGYEASALETSFYLCVKSTNSVLGCSVRSVINRK